MTRISYDRSSQCWREDPNGNFLGVWDEKSGWIPMYTVGEEIPEELKDESLV